MHDRNGTTLQPGELVRYRFDTIDVTAEVVRAGPGGTVVVAVPFPSSSGMGPMTVSGVRPDDDGGAERGCSVGLLARRDVL